MMAAFARAMMEAASLNQCDIRLTLNMKNQSNDDGFEVGTSQDLQQKYGLSAENRPGIHLDPAKVPARFHYLIPLAEKYGIGDDIIRDDVIASTPAHELAELEQVTAVYDALLEDWLAGPEAYSAEISDEYAAFSCLSMAAELYQVSRDAE